MKVTHKKPGSARRAAAHSSSRSPKPSGTASSSRAWAPRAPPRREVRAPEPSLPAPPENAIRQLSTSPTWSALPPRTQQALSTLASGESPLAGRTRWGLANLLASPTFQSAEPAAQARQVQELLSGPPVLPSVTSFDAASQARAPAAFTISGPTPAPAHPFPGGAKDAERFTVTVAGREVPVYLPADRQFTPPLQHTVEEVAQALAQMPPASRALVNEVNLTPKENPEDAFWARTYGQAGFHAYMTCGADGRIDIYPSDTNRVPRYLADTLTHETGHAWSTREWGDDPQAEAWGPWRDAVRQDGLLPSSYGGASPAEDAAETTSLYLAMRGTPLEAEYRRLYPNRFALLDREFGGRP